MNKILKPFKDFAKTYIDDIVSFLKKIEIYIHHFRQFFGIPTFYEQKKIPELSQHHFSGTKNGCIRTFNNTGTD